MKKILIVILVIGLLLFACREYRHFYKVGDMTFTVWRLRDTCYVMPYRYLGVVSPKDNYIIASYNGVSVYVDKDSTLFISDGHYDTTCKLSEYKFLLITAPYKRINIKDYSSKDDDTIQNIYFTKIDSIKKEVDSIYSYVNPLPQIHVYIDEDWHNMEVKTQN
jgi:hypothetical protein